MADHYFQSSKMLFIEEKNNKLTNEDIDFASPIEIAEQDNNISILKN